MTPTPTWLRAALVATAMLAGCSGDGGGDAGPTSSVGERTSSTTTTTRSPAVEPGCDPVAAPADASNVSEATADVDGDGAADRARSHRLSAGSWHLQVDLATGGGADTAVVTPVDSVVVLGGADVDGDGADELWARTGSGASAMILGLARFSDCALTQVTFETGAPAELPVGGTVGTATGLACDARLDTASDLTAYTARNVGDDRYELTAIEYALDGDVLRETARETSTVAADDDAFFRATSFSCGALAL